MYRCCLKHFVAVFVGSCVSAACVSLGNLQAGRQHLCLLTETAGGLQAGPLPSHPEIPPELLEMKVTSVSLKNPCNVVWANSMI